MFPIVSEAISSCMLNWKIYFFHVSPKFCFCMFCLFSLIFATEWMQLIVGLSFVVILVETVLPPYLRWGLGRLLNLEIDEGLQLDDIFCALNLKILV